MIKIEILNKIKGYIGISNNAGYVIHGADKLKNYTHKIYLVIYREDGGKTIEKTVDYLKKLNPCVIKLGVDNFNYVTNTDNCKLLAIKNKGIADQIIKLLT